MKKLTSLLLLAVFLITGCAANTTRTPRSATTKTPSTQPPASRSTSTPIPSPTDEPTEAPTITPTPTIVPFLVNLTQDTICRLGPGENYYKMVTELKGETVELHDRNEDSTWVSINENAYDNESPTCWIPVSAFENLSNLDELSIAKYETLPFGPASITATNGVCGNKRPMIVEWSPVVDGAEYRLYRNWKMVSTQTGGKYYDTDMPDAKNKATVFTYMVQGINDYGTSPAIAVSVSVCGK